MLLIMLLIILRAMPNINRSEAATLLALITTADKGRIGASQEHLVVVHHRVVASHELVQ